MKIYPLSKLDYLLRLKDHYAADGSKGLFNLGYLRNRVNGKFHFIGIVPSQGAE